MRFLKTRLFFTLMVVVCLAGAFMSITHAHAASVKATHPLDTVGNGCTQSSNGPLLACISIDSKGMVKPDGYVTDNTTLKAVTIKVLSIHNGTPWSGTNETDLQNVSGHFFGPTFPMTRGDQYQEKIIATLYNGSRIEVDSPVQNT